MAAKYDLDGPQPIAATVEGAGKWVIAQEINPIDDTQSVFLSLIADSGVSTSINRTPIIFVVRCKSGKIEAYFIWHDYLGNETHPVLLRIGKGKAYSEVMSISANSEATFYDSGKLRAFLKALVSEERLIAQTTPYDENPVTAIFDIKGLRNALMPFREACDWQPEDGVGYAWESEYSGTLYYTLYGTTTQSSNPANVRLRFNCSENKTGLKISWPDDIKFHGKGKNSFSDSGETSMRINIGNSYPQIVIWSFNYGSSLSYTEYTGKAYMLAKKMLASTVKKFTATATLESGKTITATFDTTGMDKAMKGIRKACSW